MIKSKVAFDFEHKISHSWKALRHRNFKLFFAGQGISVIGTWMTRMATSWLVYRLTNSALLLGIVSFSGQIVPFLLQPLAGVWVERLDRQKILVWTQVAAGIQSLIMAVLTLLHVINLWEIIALSILQGVVNAFDTPARQSFLVQMVDDKADLGNAIAINSSIQNGARLIGPTFAAIVIGAFGEGWCFLIDGISYIPVIVSLLMMRIKKEEARKHATMMEQMREGWTYVSTFMPVRNILILFFITSLMGYPYTVFLPVFAREIFHGDAHTLGILTSASGLGALASALSLVFRKSVDGLIHVVQFAAGLLGIALVLFAFSHVFWASLIFLFLAGFGLMQVAAGCNTVIQSVVTEDKRARAMSYYAMAFYGAAPIGSLFSGILAEKIGVNHTVMITGVCCLLGSIWFYFEVPKFKELLQRK
jgi:MFS family permease